MEKKNAEYTITVEDRGAGSWLLITRLLDRLGWTYYPTNVTGEEIDAGDDSDAARDETIEVPAEDVELFELLDESGVFDNC